MSAASTVARATYPADAKRLGEALHRGRTRKLSAIVAFVAFLAAALALGRPALWFLTMD